MSGQYLSKYDDEQSLVSSFGKGDVAAMEFLVERYGRPLYFYASAITKDETYAHDIMQDCFVRLWERRGTFISVLSIRVFLYKTAHNLSLDYLRRSQTRHRHEAAVRAELSEDFLNEKMIEEELIGRLHDAVGRLPAESARIFRLSLEGMTTAEIAEKLDISVNTVKTQKQRARKALREWLGNGLLLLILTAPDTIL